MGCGTSKSSTESVCQSTPALPISDEPSKFIPVQLEVPPSAPHYNGQPPNLEENMTNRSQRSSLVTTDFVPINSDIQWQYICNTQISLEWLYQKMIEKFRCPEEPQPQWIAERLNPVIDPDGEQTAVLRVTLGWENETLPGSVVLKVCVLQQDEDPDKIKHGLRMFKRECHAYEWLSRFRKLHFPRIYVIKKQANESGNAVIVMEDLAERAHQSNVSEGLTVESTRDLLRCLAMIHAFSLKNSDWTTTIFEDSLFFYKQLTDKARKVLANWTTLAPEQRAKIDQYLEPSYINNIVSETCAAKNIRPCLIHGAPAAHCVFVQVKEKVGAIIDWASYHPGCYGEDVTKAICFNLNAKDRRENTGRLLEFYHFNLLKAYGAAMDETTLEQVKMSYHTFFPVAAVKFFTFLPENIENADPSVLERAQGILDDLLLL